MKQTATLEKVRDAYLELERSGDKVSVRKVVELTGGSHSTVTPLIRQFEEQRRQERELSITMSESFRHAYVNDIHNACEKAKEELGHALESVHENEQDLLGDLSAAEDKIKTLEAQIETSSTEAEEQARTADNRMAALAQKVTDLEQERERDWEEKKQLQEQITLIRSDFSEKQLLLSQSLEKGQTLQQEIDAQRHKLTEQQAQIVDEEKRADLATSRWENIQEQLHELKAELKETRQQLETERDRRTEAEKKLARMEAVNADSIEK